MSFSSIVGSSSVTFTKRKAQLDTHDQIVFRQLSAHFPQLAIPREEGFAMSLWEVNMRGAQGSTWRRSASVTARS